MDAGPDGCTAESRPGRDAVGCVEEEGDDKPDSGGATTAATTAAATTTTRTRKPASSKTGAQERPVGCAHFANRCLGFQPFAAEDVRY
uniref:Uncharacterized protein n=1 Tax=Panagrellus redivivus TaxID=6233 RepID=A0A7E4ZQU0_PANRE